MDWDAKDVALLKRLWAAGQSAAEIARRLGSSRNAVCGMLTRLGLKRGPQAANSKTHDQDVPQAKAVLVGRLRTSSSKEGVAEPQQRGSSLGNSASSSFTPF
ncbi:MULTISPECIES: GcrA family cell cycle regulator [unclassified Bradyrhizobium]|uniref:GcrA family cell cycle regulator n=1 Tax=unclassified Bradyrhizobium TaxID=2631580 RepID=UPI001FF8C31F|nr:MULTISPECIES: GcrA family cell cycle regulator [unclassified Bradyrhizobium]